MAKKNKITSDPAKVAADMRTARTPEGGRLFSREEWLTKSQVQGFFSRLSAARRKEGNKDIDLEDAKLMNEEEERLGLLSEVAAQLGPKHPICYDTYCLCDCLQEDQLDMFSVAMLKGNASSL